MNKILTSLVAAGLAAQPLHALAQTSPSPMGRDRPDNAPVDPRLGDSLQQGVAERPVPSITPFVLTRVEIEGSSVPASAFEPAWRPFVGRSIDGAGLNALSDAVAAAYERDTNVALYTVLVPQQAFSGGVVRLAVVEGRLGSVRASGHGADLMRRYSQDAVEERPLTRSTLQRSISLIRDTPGLTPYLGLEPTAEHGVVDLVARTEGRRLQLGAAVNNRGTAFLGRTQVQFDLFANSAITSGDQVRLTVAFPTDAERFQFAGLNYSVPVGDDGVRIGASGSWLRTRPEGLNLNGEATAASIYVNWPAIRDYRRSLVLGGVLDGVNSENALFGQTISSDRVRTARGAAAWGWTDGRRLFAVNAIGSQGIDALGARVTDPAFARVDFRKLNLRASYNQMIGETWVARLSGAAQLSSDRLPATEQFALGGEEFGRGFESAYVVGDRGHVAAAEVAFRPRGLPSSISGSEAFVYADWGEAYTYARPGAPGERREIASAGAGVRVAVANRLLAQVEASRPLVTPDSYPERRDWRLLFSLKSLF